MNDASLHELSAGYALDALDGDALRAFESHLATCERCRSDVASLRETAAALAYDVQPVPVPETLERRILSAARAEPRNVVPLRQRWALPAAGVAAVAAGVAIALGIWSIQLSNSLDRERAAHSRDARVIAVLSQPGAEQIRARGGNGMLVVAPTREGVLIANSLPAAGRGKTYEAWVIANNRPQPAGLFRGGAGSKVLALTRPVPPGATVGVTLEKAGGARTPTLPILLQASA